MRPAQHRPQATEGEAEAEMTRAGHCVRKKRPASRLATPRIICLCKGSAKLQPAKRRMVSDATQTGRGDGAKQTDNAAAPVHNRNRAKRLSRAWGWNRM